MLGNQLNPADVQSRPSVVWWPAKADTYYTLSMVDPDAPDRKTHIYREINHWLVVNIPLQYIDKGIVIASYTGSMPPAGSGNHRYVFLVYQQPNRLDVKEPIITNNSLMRRNFNIRQFSEKYNLGDPVAVNFFLAKYSN